MTCVVTIYIFQNFLYINFAMELSAFLMRRRLPIGLGRETFENVGRVFMNVWAVEYFCGMVGVLNSLETDKQAPHIRLMEVLQALDNTGAFQRSEPSPSQIIAQCACVNGGRADQREWHRSGTPRSRVLGLPRALASHLYKGIIIALTSWSSFDHKNIIMSIKCWAQCLAHNKHLLFVGGTNRLLGELRINQRRPPFRQWDTRATARGFEIRQLAVDLSSSIFQLCYPEQVT